MPVSPPDHRCSRSPRGDRGQAAIDYLGVVAVVALILGVIGTVTIGPSVVNGVGEAFQRALCKVTGDSCVALERPVCTVRTTSSDGKLGVSFTFVKLGQGINVVRSERSDGTVEVTLLDKVDAGLIAKAGARGSLQLGDHDLGVSGIAQASAVAQLGGGRMWRLPDAAAADDLQSKIKKVLIGRGASKLPALGVFLKAGQHLFDVGEGTDLPKATQVIGSLKGEVSAKLDGPFGSDLNLGGSTTLGGSLDKVTGGVTAYVAIGASGGAALLDGMADIGLDGDVRLALSFDKHGTPTTAVLSGSGTLKGSGNKTSDQGGDRLKLNVKTTQGRMVQLSATLDLTAPESRAAAQRLVHALTPAGVGDLLGAARNLGSAFADHTRLDVATYGKKEKNYGGDLELAAGAVVGVEAKYNRTKTNLLDAWTRPAGGAWEQRTDCLQA